MAIQDISFVKYMPHLKYFIVIDAPLMYIDAISTCKELIYLEFFWTWINDYTPLLGCTALEDLNVARTNGDILTFKDMPWLKFGTMGLLPGLLALAYGVVHYRRKRN